MASDNFINMCKEPANGNRLGIITNNNEIVLNQDNYIQDFTIDDGCYVNGSLIGTTYVKKINANLIGSYNIDLEDKDLKVKVGVKYDDDTEEYIDLGNYVVEKPKDEATKNYSQITAYDHTMNKLDHAYICNLDFSTPKTFSDLFGDLCDNLGLTPKSLFFDNSDMPLIGNPFTNGEKNREVLQTIEKISCTFSQIDNETNEIELCWLSQNENPDYIFTLDDYTNLNGGKIVYGPINSLVIKNSQIDDENVSISDEESIAQNGEHQLVISEDYLLYTPELRQQAINAIWNKVHNLTYVDCELETHYGKPFLKIGDKIRIYKDEENYFDTYVLTHQFKYDGSFYSKITSPVLTKQQVQTKQDVSLGEILKNAMVTVDKINSQIVSVVEKTEILKESIEALNPKLDNNIIFVSTNKSKIPFATKEYVINFTTEFIGQSVSITPATNDEYLGITCNATNESITFEVKNDTAIENETNSFIFTWSYEHDGTIYTQTRTITLNTLISESEQNVVISENEPSDISVLWFNTNEDKIYVYDNGSWISTNDYETQLENINEALNGDEGINNQLSNLQNQVGNVDEKLKNKVDNSTFNTFKTSVTETIGDTYKKEEVQMIVNGTGVDGVTVTSVKITETSTFDINGMHYQKTGEDTITTINEKGLSVADKDNNELLFAGVRKDTSDSIVETDNLKVKTFLECSNGMGRFEKFGNGVGFFIIGGDS